MNFDDLDISSIVVEGIDMKDYPDFVDSHAVEACWKNGKALTELELEELTAEGSIVQELAHQEMF